MFFVIWCYGPLGNMQFPKLDWIVGGDWIVGLECKGLYSELWVQQFMYSKVYSNLHRHNCMYVLGTFKFAVVLTDHGIIKL